VAYAGDVDLADKTVGEISGHGRRGAAFAADIADEGAVAQGSPTLVARQEQAGPSEPLTEPTPVQNDETPATVRAALPALYGRNARSVAGGMRASTISMIA